MKLKVGQALGEVGERMRRDGGKFLTIALAFTLMPTLLVGLRFPQGPKADDTIWLPLLTVVVILGFVGHAAIQRLTYGTGEQIGQAVRASGRPALRVLAAVVLLFLPVAILLVPFIPGYQSGDPALQGPAATAMMLILLIALFPLSRMLLLQPAAAIEKGSFFGLFRRSWQLTKGNNWKLYGLVLLFLVLLALISTVAQQALGSVVLLAFGQPKAWSVSALLLSLLTQLAQMAVTLPFVMLLARLYAQATGDAPAVAVSLPDAGASA